MDREKKKGKKKEIFIIHNKREKIKQKTKLKQRKSWERKSNRKGSVDEASLIKEKTKKKKIKLKPNNIR